MRQLRNLKKCTSRPSSWGKKGRFTQLLPSAFGQEQSWDRALTPLYFGLCTSTSIGSSQGETRNSRAEVRGGAEVGTVGSYLHEAGWSLYKTGYHCCGWNKRQGQENLKACLRNAWNALHTVAQVAYCSTLGGIIHIITTAAHFPAPSIGFQLRFCLKELPVIKKKMQKQNKNKIKPLKAAVPE